MAFTELKLCMCTEDALGVFFSTFFIYLFFKNAFIVFSQPYHPSRFELRHVKLLYQDYYFYYFYYFE